MSWGWGNALWEGGGWELSDGAVPLCTQFGDIPKGCRGVGGTQGVMG